MIKKLLLSSIAGITLLTGVTASAAPQTMDTVGIPTAQERATKKVHAKAEAYDGMINKYAEMYNVPSKLVHAIIRYESSYNPNAVGGVGEIGLMQIRPETAKHLGYKGTTAGLHDPETNIRYGVKYLAGAHRLSGGDICGTVLKYNAGHGAKKMNPISAKYCQTVKQYIS